MPRTEASSKLLQLQPQLHPQPTVDVTIPPTASSVVYMEAQRIMLRIARPIGSSARAQLLWRSTIVQVFALEWRTKLILSFPADDSFSDRDILPINLHPAARVPF